MTQANTSLQVHSPFVPTGTVGTIGGGNETPPRPKSPSPAPDAPRPPSASTAPRSAPQTAPELPRARVELHLDKDSGLIVSRVVDRRTNEEIRQIPSEVMVRMAAALKKEIDPRVNIKA